ncbi:uncharacterized protein LOC136076184 [Hydra vulgaris]|uniref:Uncharacterized protein LOC136076184 n=1 Tax=Hydra vulgaris TaxID=6087 RepID=A0ABM4B9Z6_HYDVU
MKCLETKNINIERIVSVATDGAPAMIAKNKGFIKLFSSHISHEIISFHCILHQEALVAKSLGALPQLKNVMEVIVPIDNLYGSACSHIAVLHFKVETYIRLKFNKIVQVYNVNGIDLKSIDIKALYARTLCSCFYSYTDLLFSSETDTAAKIDEMCISEPLTYLFEPG